MKRTIILITGLLATGGCALSQSSSTPPSYQIVRRIPLEGNGFWDYLTVEESAERLFVSHGNQVQVIDLRTGKQAGAISGLKGVHGVAYAPDVEKGFISCGGDTSVVVFDLKTLAVTNKIETTGANPDAILYDPFSRHIFVFNHGGNNVTVIAEVTDKVLATIPLEGSPEFAVTNGKGFIYANIEDKSEVAVINATTLKVEKTWPVAPGEEPTGLTYDPQTNRLFSVCGNKQMVILDAQTGAVVQTVPIGNRVDGAAFDPDTQLAFSSNGEGTLTVIDAGTTDAKVVQTLPTQMGARTIALDRHTHRLYLPTAEFEAGTQPDRRPTPRPGSFMVLEVAPEK